MIDMGRPDNLAPKKPLDKVNRLDVLCGEPVLRHECRFRERVDRAILENKPILGELIPLFESGNKRHAHSLTYMSASE